MWPISVHVLSLTISQIKYLRLTGVTVLSKDTPLGNRIATSNSRIFSAPLLVSEFSKASAIPKTLDPSAFAPWLLP